MAWLTLLLVGVSTLAQAAEREIELRGTLLCRVDGDARRERPIESQMLIVEPVGHASGAEVIGEAGLFRVRVPESLVDHQLILRIHQGRQEIHSLSIFLDAARVKQVGDRRVCQLGAFSLPGSCDDRTGTAADAVTIRDEIRQGAGGTEPVRGSKPKPWQGVTTAALVGAGAVGVGGAAAAGDLGASGGLVPVIGPGGGDWPVFQQFCASPALGRTVTARRNPEEAALWNPAALTLAGGSHLAAGYGETDEGRASVGWQLPVSANASWLVPRSLSAAVVGYFGNETTVAKFENMGTQITTDNRQQDIMGTAALGWRLTPDLSFSAGYRGVWQERGSFITEGPLEGAPGPEDPLTLDRTNEFQAGGVDLNVAWDARPDLRVGLGAYALFGGEYQSDSETSTPFSRGALGAAWTRNRWSISAEGGLNAGELNAAAAVEFQAASWLGLSVAAGSRYEAVQGGADVTVGWLTGRGRIRTDDLDDVSGWVGLMVGR